jgi:hypothetical protein
MRDEIERLDLAHNIVELELYGYTIVENVKPLSFFDELRTTILKLGEEDLRAGTRVPLAESDGNSYLVPWLMARGRVFEEALMAEKPLRGSWARAVSSAVIMPTCVFRVTHHKIYMQMHR